MRILVPFGTRPEIVKLAPVIRELSRRRFDIRTVATGQHYDAALTEVFYTSLGVQPDDTWTLSGDEAGRVGQILEHAHRQVQTDQPDLVLVLGDTNTVPLFCLAARRHCIPIAHLEAGLRSFNETSMEEVNRKVAAALASLHLAPTDTAAGFLLREGVARPRIKVVGNSVLDVLRERGVVPRPPAERRGVVVTAHRASNVDDPVRLAALTDVLHRLAEEFPPITFPVHPRTQHRLDAGGHLPGLSRRGLRVVEPMPYEEMLELVGGARVVVTDSGGLQEEAAWLGVPVVVLRRSTPRWEGIRARTSVLTGMEADVVMDAVRRFHSPEEQARVAAAPCPYGDGHTAARVADVLGDPEVAELLSIGEPDFVDRDAPA